MKIFLDMIGCRLNQSEIEIMARQFTAAGHSLVGDPKEADLAVVNTCTVTSAAAADSRKAIRRIARSGVKKIVSTGCWSTLAPEEALDLPGVIQVVSNAEKDQLVPEILSLEPELFDQEPLERVLIPGARLRTRAFVKVEDGCNHQCTFCITTGARGKSRSISQESVIGEINTAVLGGAQEAVLTGVQLGSWGKDMDSSLELNDLIRGVLKNTDIPRLRLSSIEPWDISPALIDTLVEERVARHLHLPLQSGSPTVMRRMARAITPDLYAENISRIREKLPDIAITTDIMAGFPGETEKEFNDNLDFIRSIKFADGHVFVYSAREGTLAVNLPDHIPHDLRKERSANIRDILEETRLNYQEQFLDREVEVLWEKVDKDPDGSWIAVGLTGNYLRVAATASPEVWNTISTVRILSINDDGIRGIIIQ